MNVFLSCVSTEFKSYRLRLANHLGALKGHPYEIKVQEDFLQGGGTLLERLAEYIRDCDLVIHLVGDASGARPTAEHVQTLYRSLGQKPPDPLPDWSYTQWEYRLALRFQRKMLVYLATAEAPRGCLLPVQQSGDAARLQQAHRAAIKAGGKHYGSFTRYHTLLKDVFHDFELEDKRRINNLPLPSLGSLFKGRDDVLKDINKRFGSIEYRGYERVPVIGSLATAVAVHGLGGSGKTRVAVEYAHRYIDEYTALLFVLADSKDGLQQSVAALCGETALDLPEKTEREIQAQEGAVLRWLQQHAGWLLIFDNADTDEAARAVSGLIGRLTPSGEVLITSRLSNWEGAVKTLLLDVLAAADATKFLLERTDARRTKAPDDEQQARTVAGELGKLPLALEQAGAYIQRYRFTFSQYLGEWHKQRDKVLEWFDDRVMQYPRSVAVTWQTSFDSLAAPAQRLLRILAWLAPDPIPDSLLEAGGGPFAAQAEDKRANEADAREALADLDEHSLVTYQPPTFSVHRLVQDVTRRSLRGNGENQDLKLALRWVDAPFACDARDVRNWPVLTPLAAHALTVTQYADAAQISEPTARLMNNLGQLYDARGQYVEAEALCRRALEIDGKFHGSEHPDVARDLNNLAALLGATNRLGEAEPLYRRALAIDEKAYGHDDTHVARDLNNLVLVLKATNRLGEAEPLMKRALAIDEQSYGSEHPKVAIRLSNLAQLLRATNRLGEAEPLMKRALAIDEKAYGPDHPNVAIDLNNLAGLWQTTNRLGEAEPLMKRALAIDEEAYGPDHPNVARDLNNLAQLLQATDRLGEAEPLMKRALAIDEEAYGPDHPKVAIRLNNLAQLLQATDRLGEAEPLMKRVVDTSEKAYGPEHPDVATALNNLAQLLQATNRPGEAEPLMKRALAIDEKSCGPDHPGVARDLNNLALLLKTMNRLQEAEPLYRRALAIDEKSYGLDHPNVAIALNNLALLLQHTNRLGEAEPLMRRVFEIFLKFTRDTGHGQPNFRAAIGNYVGLLQQMGYTEGQVRGRMQEIATKEGSSSGDE